MAILYVLAFVALLSVNSARDSVEFTKDSLAIIKKNVAAGTAVLVDVRSEQEWNRGHLKGSIFVPVTTLRKGGDPKKLAKVLPKNKVLYTFCVVGMRAKTAAYELSKHGYTVRAVKPGYDDFLKAGFKKATPPAKKDESTRQRNAG
jgi:rhodanese-related sulfurtransferase